MSESGADRVPDAQIRVGDAEREAVLERLSAAHATGRLDLAEFDERSAAVVHAKTRGDLAALTVDLPAEERTAVTRPSEGSRPAGGDSTLDPSPGRRLDKRLSGVLRSALLVVIITNAIWLASLISRDGDEPAPDYWPVWPLLAMVIWVAATALSTRDSRGR